MIRPILFLLALLTATASAPGAIAQGFPSTPPAPGPPRPFELPEGRTFALDNGIDVTFVPYGDVPKANVYAVVRTGNVDEAPGQSSLADLAVGLLTEGTTTRSAEDIARQAADMGGSVNAGAGLDQTFVTGRVLSEFTPALVELVADVIQNPAFSQDAFERVQRDLVRGAAVGRSQPGTVARAAFSRALYGEHPYAAVVLPDPAQIEAATVADAQSFYRTNVMPQRTRIYVVGRFDEAAVESAIRDAFGDWRTELGAPMRSEPPEAASGRRILLVDQPGAAQSNVVVGLPTLDPSDPDFVALQVTNALLGGSFGSRITRNIREDKGYTYSPGSSVASRYRTGYWAESAAVVTESTGPALREILYEIDSLATNPPDAAELEGIQNYLAGTFVLQNSSAGGIAAFLAFLDLHGLGRDYLEEYTQRVYAVTPEDVSRVTRDYIRGDDLTIVVVGDRSVVEPQLAPFGAVTIETIP